jgi:hypothetical protein
MTILLTCKCGKELKADESLAGKRVKCPRCSAIFTAPLPQQIISAPNMLPPLPTNSKTCIFVEIRPNDISNVQEPPSITNANNDLSFTCPFCKKPFRINVTNLGKTVACPSCKKAVQLPDHGEVEVYRPASFRKTLFVMFGVGLGILLLIVLGLFFLRQRHLSILEVNGIAINDISATKQYHIRFGNTDTVAAEGYIFLLVALKCGGDPAIEWKIRVKDKAGRTYSPEMFSFLKEGSEVVENQWAFKVEKDSCEFTLCFPDGQMKPIFVNY